MPTWFGRMEEATFKAVEGGYVFAAPNPRVFGPRRYYVLNDTQKAAVIDCQRLAARRMAPLIVAIVLIGAVLLVGAPIYIGSRLGDAVLLFGMPILALFTVVTLELSLVRLLEPVLKDLPRTNVTISLSERHLAIARAMPTWLLIVCCASGVVMLAGGALQLLHASAGGRGQTASALVSLAAGILIVVLFVFTALRKWAAR
jgi:hypothetical protein